MTIIEYICFILAAKREAKTTEESFTNQARTRRKKTPPNFDALLCQKIRFSFIALTYFALAEHVSCSWLT